MSNLPPIQPTGKPEKPVTAQPFEKPQERHKRDDSFGKIYRKEHEKGQETSQPSPYDLSKEPKERKHPGTEKFRHKESNVPSNHKQPTTPNLKQKQDFPSHEESSNQDSSIEGKERNGLPDLAEKKEKEPVKTQRSPEQATASSKQTPKETATSKQPKVSLPTEIESAYQEYEPAFEKTDMYAAEPFMEATPEENLAQFAEPETLPLNAQEQIIEQGQEEPYFAALQEENLPQESKLQKTESLSEKEVALESKAKQSGSVERKEKGKSESKPSGIPAERPEMAAAATAPIQGMTLQTETGKMQEQPQVDRSIADLVDQMVEKIEVLQTGDQTSTIVTLRSPEIFSGATVTLTTTDNAKREFNITFANLSPDAKTLLDQKINELTKSLESKNIVVHMIRTTEQPEMPIRTEAGPPTKDQEGREGGQRDEGEGSHDSEHESSH